MNDFLAGKIQNEYYRCRCKRLPVSQEVIYRAGAEAMAKILLPLLAQSLPAISLQMVYVERNERHGGEIEELFEKVRECLEPKHLPRTLAAFCEKID